MTQKKNLKKNIKKREDTKLYEDKYFMLNKKFL